MTATPSTKAAIAEFSTRLRRSVGARLRRLVLFGSRARGEATEDSDVDLLVVVDHLTPDDARIVDAAVGEILTRTDVLLSPLLLSTARFEELRDRERAIIAEIERDGVAV